MSSSKRTHRKLELSPKGDDGTPKLPLEVDVESAAKSLGGASSGRTVSNTKKLVSNVLQAARTVASALANPGIPNPALAHGTAALKQSMRELLNSGDLENLEASASKLVEDALKEATDTGEAVVRFEWAPPWRRVS